MCKFTNRLFVFVILSLFYAELFVEASPCSKKRKKCDSHKELSEYDQDIHIDQTQKGGENLRINMDGFFIGLRQPSSDDLINIGETLLGDLGNELVLNLSNKGNKTSEPLGLFDFKGLNSRANKQTSDVPKLETIVIEKDANVHQGLESDMIGEHEGTAQTKLRIYRLLNLLQNFHKN